jgi:pilus assembly protein CpaF
VIRHMLASAIQIVAQCSRMSDGSRKVTTISEVIGVDRDRVEMRDLFTLERAGLGPRGRILGRFAATGARPHFLDRLKAQGVHLPASIFTEVQELKDR